MMFLPMRTILVCMHPDIIWIISSIGIMSKFMFVVVPDVVLLNDVVTKRKISSRLDITVRHFVLVAIVQSLPGGAFSGSSGS